MPKTKDGGFKLVDGDDPFGIDKLKPPKKTERDNDPCWETYEQVGMKTKNGKQVPNCVPKKRGKNAK